MGGGAKGNGSKGEEKGGAAAEKRRGSKGGEKVGAASWEACSSASWSDRLFADGGKKRMDEGRR